jgi:hypothetical protein
VAVGLKIIAHPHQQPDRGGSSGRKVF